MVLQNGPIIRSPFGRVAPPSTSVGDQLRDNFEHAILDICGDTRLFWLPRRTETTTSTDRSRNARTFTYDATVAARYGIQGSGVTVDFDGSNDEADVPDNNDYSFGDSTTDEPFSILALVYPDTISGVDNILSKFDSQAGGDQEWRLILDDGKPSLYCYDDSATAYIGALTTALSAGAWSFVVGTYDGSAQRTGIRVYKNGLLTAQTLASAGTYVAMENGAELVRLGFAHDTNSPTEFFDGRMAFVALVARHLVANDVWALTKIVNSYFDLTF